MTLSRALGAFLFVFAAGCNCGRAPLTKTEASLTLSSDTLDFGAVTEGTSKSAKFHLDNTGRAPINVAASFAAGSSAEFALSPVSPTVEAGGFVEGLVTFTPKGPGEDTGIIDIVATDKPEEPALHVSLHGGPISPGLSFDPDPLDFRPAMTSLDTKTVQLRSVGTAALTVRSVGVASTSNPDFSVVPPTLPAVLLPGSSLPVQVQYARSQRSTEGMLEALSDDADAGLKRLRLLPDPPGQCSDGIDNDGDGLTDFPDDPGCQDAQDNDEYNPSQCVNGGMQPCGNTDGGGCRGTRTCANSVWGPCQNLTCTDGGTDAGTDAGTGDGGCNPNGIFTLDAGRITYGCCVGLVSVDINQFQILGSGTTVLPGPTQPGTTLTSASATSCPSGNFDVTKTLPGTCNETYRLVGTFTSANTFSGTYSATFTGTTCDCYGIDPCTDQTWNISAGR